MTNDLHQLAQKLGIATSFSSMGRDLSEVSDDLIKFFCNEFGADVSSKEAIDKSFEQLRKKDLEQVVAPIYVRRENDINIDISILKENNEADIELLCAFGGKHETKSLAYKKTLVDESDVNGQIYQKWVLNIQDKLTIGYYQLNIRLGSNVYETLLAVAPDKCYDIDRIKNNKLWGFSIQLYALKSRRNWGIGDFTDLKNFAKITAGVGADIIGINPINTPFHDFP